MAAYRFRITFEDQEDVYREIEIKSVQTFEDLHRTIQQSIEFDNSKPASFFMSDDMWRKGAEIMLSAPESIEEDSPKPKLMKECKLSKFIEDPHQKFLYVSDPDAGNWNFYVELVKILAEEPKTNYPQVVKNAGIAPKQYKPTVIPQPDEEDDFFDDDEGEKSTFPHENTEALFDEGEDHNLSDDIEGETNATPPQEDFDMSFGDGIEEY